MRSDWILRAASPAHSLLLSFVISLKCLCAVTSERLQIRRMQKRWGNAGFPWMETPKNRAIQGATASVAMERDIGGSDEVTGEACADTGENWDDAHDRGMRQRRRHPRALKGVENNGQACLNRRRRSVEKNGMVEETCIWGLGHRENHILEKGTRREDRRG